MTTATDAARSHRRTLLLPTLAGLLLLGALVVGVLLISRWAAGPSRQAEVAGPGTAVMPFDLARTTHSFTDAPDGGQEVVVATSTTDSEQIGLIQSHLVEEARKFSRGDFSDPAAIHGEEMPGLRQLSAGAARISFVYEPWPNGGAITYRTNDPTLVDALHRWFAAQRGDHGAH